MSKNWSNSACGDIRLKLIEDVFDNIWYSTREKIDDLQGLKDGIARMIRDLRQEAKK